jgi:hypothetical protein
MHGNQPESAVESSKVRLEKSEELKRFGNRYIVSHIAGIGGCGASVAVPADLSYHGRSKFCIQHPQE